MSGNVTTSGTEAWCRTTSPAVSGGAGRGAWGPEAGPPRQGSPRYLLLVPLGSLIVCVPSPPFGSSSMKLAQGLCGVRDLEVSAQEVSHLFPLTL